MDALDHRLRRAAPAPLSEVEATALSITQRLLACEATRLRELADAAPQPAELLREAAACERAGAVVCRLRERHKTPSNPGVAAPESLT